MTLGERIRKSREEKGYMQSQLAEMVGVKSASIISNWEKDINKPDAEKLIKLCRVLDVSAAYMLDYYGRPSENLSPEALALARRYDEIQDPLDRKMVEFAVNIGLLRNAPHDARPAMPPLFSEEWFEDRIYGEDPRVARRQDVDVIGRGRRG